jgi:hypothetical protein
LEIKKISRSQSHITDENKEIMLFSMLLFKDPNLFGYVRNTWSRGSCKVSYGRTYPNKFQTSSSKNIKRYGYRMQKAKTGT